MKQITSSVTFLPMLDEDECYSFKIITHTHEGSEPLNVPSAWEDADYHLINRGKVEQVRLRSFSTNAHRLEASRFNVPPVLPLTLRRQ
ncbi:hypothetical protein B9479_002480 [Cryptococcus floricola]|uniref:HORMA domain-containing protein n=1 Tax=Cryptococcus floricola TaxID=2591691 RepID=A0A5D3B2U3_9TREE|nr:hypothetical protein B9479_002480 [Cryptococcus floricola]